jgi:hydrogenase maturation protease
MMKEWLIIGLGNPILGDDGVGWKVADELMHWCATSDNSYQSLVEIETAALGGLSLMERMAGYQGVILIDALETGRHPPGTVRVFPLNELENPSHGHSASTHDTTLMTALETGRSMGIPLPREILVVAIEAIILYDFSESLTEAVAAAVPLATREVKEILARVFDSSPKSS